MLFSLIQQFGKDIVGAIPVAAEAGTREAKALRDPYTDKSKYWLSRGGEWEIDADEHRVYDGLSAEAKRCLATMQRSGESARWNSLKPKDHRPWTGARDVQGMSAAELFISRMRPPADPPNN